MLLIAGLLAALVGCAVEPSRFCECGRTDGSALEERRFDCDDPAAEEWMRDYQDSCDADCACVCSNTECINAAFAIRAADAL